MCTQRERDGGTVLPFQKRKSRKPLARDLARHVRKMLKDGKMVMPYPHVKRWLLSKNITAMQMLTTIEKEPLSEIRRLTPVVIGELRFSD